MRHVPRRPRGVLIAVMLLASLLVASLLALQAHRTFLHHRATAERVLRDYARLAASRFALRTGYNLYYMAAWPQMEALLRTQVGAPGAPLPRPERLAPGLKPDAAAALKRARYTFRLDLTSGRLATSGAKLYHSPVQYAATFSARDTVEAMMGGMQVAVALRPELASKLVIGGLPRSRLPVLLGVLALTTGLIVTALVQLQREYELSRLRTDFVSGVSHELRTPLSQIRMFSETLLLGRVRSEEEGRRSLEIIDQEARRLTHLVENLLHFSRSERQVTRLSPARAPLAPLVQEALEGFAPLAGARGVRLRSELAEGAGGSSSSCRSRAPPAWRDSTTLPQADRHDAHPRGGRQPRPRLRVAQQPGDRRLSGRGRGRRHEGIGARARRPARPDHPRPHASRDGRVPRVARVARSRSHHAGPHPHGAGRGIGQGARPAPGRGRLRHQTVRCPRAAGPRGGAVAARGAAPPREKRRPAARAVW